jgi:hypothetical protein
VSNSYISAAPLQVQDQVPQNDIFIRELRPLFRRVIDLLTSCFGTGQR